MLPFIPWGWGSIFLAIVTSSIRFLLWRMWSNKHAYKRHISNFAISDDNVALALVFIRQNDNRIQLIVSCKWAFRCLHDFMWIPRSGSLKRDECYCSVHAREYIAVNNIFSTDFNIKRSLWTRFRLRVITVQVSRESVEFHVRGKIYLYHYTIYSGEPSPR
jgi:hypothetical protein